MTALTVTISSFRYFIANDMLVSGELEGSTGRALLPGPGDGAVVVANVVQLALSNHVSRLTRLVFHVGFDTNRPVDDIEKDRCCRGIGTRVNGGLGFFSVPRHDDGELCALRRAGAEVAVPCSRQRMSLLCESRHNTSQQEAQLKYSSPHHSTFRPSGPYQY